MINGVKSHLTNAVITIVILLILIKASKKWNIPLVSGTF